jgi:hypothetical protein
MGTATIAWSDRLLATVWDGVAESGTTAAAADPDLRAAVARHETEIRAWLRGQGLAVTRQSIAGYAAVLLAAASRCGRRLPTDPQRYDWGDAEWYIVRLVALCAMARHDDTPVRHDDTPVRRDIGLRPR